MGALLNQQKTVKATRLPGAGRSAAWPRTRPQLPSHPKPLQQSCTREAPWTQPNQSPESGNGELNHPLTSDRKFTAAPLWPRSKCWGSNAGRRLKLVCRCETSKKPSRTYDLHSLFNRIQRNVAGDTVWDASHSASRKSCFSSRAGSWKGEEGEAISTDLAGKIQNEGNSLGNKKVQLALRQKALVQFHQKHTIKQHDEERST